MTRSVLSPPAWLQRAANEQESTVPCLCYCWSTQSCSHMHPSSKCTCSSGGPAPEGAWGTLNFEMTLRMGQALGRFLMKSRFLWPSHIIQLSPGASSPSSPRQHRSWLAGGSWWPMAISPSTMGQWVADAQLSQHSEAAALERLEQKCTLERH